MNLLQKSSTAYPLLFLMVDSADHITGKTGLSPTVTLSKNGAAFASPAGAVTELSSGWYKVAGNATDTNTNGPLLLHATGTGADPVDIAFWVVSFDPADAVRMGLTSLPNAAADAAGGLPISDAGGLDLDAKIGALRFGTANRVDAQVYGMENNTLTAAAMASDAVTEIQSGLATSTAVDDLPTNAELATALAAADDAVLVAIAALNNLSSAGAASACTTALTTALTEGYRGTGATGSVRDLLYEVIAHLGESSISSTTKTLKKLDGSTSAKTYTLDSATTPTSITEAT